MSSIICAYREGGQTLLPSKEKKTNGWLKILYKIASFDKGGKFYRYLNN